MRSELPIVHYPVRDSPRHTLPLAPLAGALLAILIGYLYFQASLSIPIIHDAAGYYRIGKQIWTEGLFSKWELSTLRTWGYPTFLGGLLRIAGLTGISERGLVFAVQLAIHIGSAFALRAAMSSAGVRRWVTETVFYVTILHPFALIYPAYMLTESLALSLGVAVLACAVALLSAPKLRFAIYGGLLCGFMIEVRPGSVFMVPVLLLALASVWFLTRPSRARMLALATATMLGLSLPLLPQLRNNFVHYGKITPLTPEPLSKYLVYVGIIWIKYATLVDPVRDPHINYLNPFATEEKLAARAPATWYMRYPGRGAATLGLHAFNLLDQDLPLPYNATLTPTYYPVVAIVNFGVIALGLAGIGMLLSGWGSWTQPEQWTAALAMLMLAGHVGLHSLFSVEARYGVAALTVLYPLAAICCRWLVRSAPIRSRIFACIFVVVFCLSGAWLSSWVRWQAPAIRAEMIQLQTR